MNQAAVQDLTAEQIRELVRAGERLWRQCHDDAPTLANVIWALLAEAAATLRSMHADKPRGFVSGWPDIDQMSQWAAENARNLDRADAAAKGLSVDPDIYLPERRTREQPTAAAVQRLLHSLTMLRWVKSKSLTTKRERMKLILALAGGLSPTRAAGMFPALGYTNRHAVLAARARSIACIEARIGEKCGRIPLNVAA